MSAPKPKKDEMRRVSRVAFERVMTTMEEFGLDPLAAGREGGNVAAAIHEYVKALSKCECG